MKEQATLTAGKLIPQVKQDQMTQVSSLRKVRYWASKMAQGVERHLLPRLMS